MPPKATTQQIEEKLQELTQFVQQNRELLAGRNPTTLTGAFKQNESKEERSWYAFLKRHNQTFTTSQQEHIQRILLSIQETNQGAPTETDPQRHDMKQIPFGVPPPKENTSHDVVLPISSATGSSCITSRKRHADTEHRHKRSKCEHSVTVTGSEETSTQKRKKDASIPNPNEHTQSATKRRTLEANEKHQRDKLTHSTEDLAELHEFRAWLETPEALKLRNEKIEQDKESIEQLLVYPPTRTSMQRAGQILTIKRNNQALTEWHDRCTDEVRQRFRRWRQGGISNMLTKHGNHAESATRETPCSAVNTIGHIQQRRSYWWTDTLTKSFRLCRVLQTQHPQLLTQDAWESLITKFEVTMRYRYMTSDKKRARHLNVTLKECIREADIIWTHRLPCIAQPEAPPNDTTKKPQRISHAFIYYQLSHSLVLQVENLRVRSDAVNATTVGIPWSDTTGVSASSSESKPRPQPMISRKKKQTQRAFLDMCRSTLHRMPYCAFEEHASTLEIGLSSDVRVLALIDMQGCRHEQLPLSNQDLFKAIHEHAETTSHQCETETEFIHTAQQRLYEFAVHPDNVYAGNRFLGMQTKSSQAIRDTTNEMVDNLLALLDNNGLRDDWAQWHPYRLATVATYLYLFVSDPTSTASRWNFMINPKRMYIPIDQIQSLPKLASHCPPSPEMLGLEVIPPCTEGENTGRALATPPVVCELCHKGFRCKEDLISHCTERHGNYMEYRKHVFWKAEEAGLQPQQWWQKRNILSAHAFFLRNSIPSSRVNDFTRTIGDAVPRRMEACAICAVKDWIEHRFQIYLFAIPDGRCTFKDIGENEELDDAEKSGASSPADSKYYHTRNDLFCVGSPDQVDKLLGVQHYIAAWPKIPKEELHASSVQHPRHPNMRWLLHSRRVPKCATDLPEPGRAQHDAPPRCAGIGEEDATVWVCRSCGRALCKHTPQMPELALANWMWLGRVHHLFRNLTLAMRLLLGLGRPVMRSLYLGRGPRDEVHRGLQGNTMIIAQPSATYKQILPDVSHALNGITVMFCKSVEDVSSAHTLTVQPTRYIAAMRHRINICPTFENVQLDEEAVKRDLPAESVPAAIIEHAVAMPEAASMRTTMDGPASRHSQFGPNPEENEDTDEDDTTKTTNAQCNHVQSEEAIGEERTNDFETIIGVDTATDDPTVHLFNTMQNKLDLLTSEAGKLGRKAEKTEEAPTAAVGAEEQCKRIVVDLQEILKKLGKTNPQRLEALVTGAPQKQIEALAIPTGKPMSTFHAATLPAAYVEFQFGDCTPFLDRPRKISCEQIFQTLSWREELEYHLESDDPTDPYQPPARSRFDDPEFVALFADTLRRMKTAQSVSAALRREGFQQDEKAVASVSSDELIRMIGTANNEKKTDAVEKAVRNLMFSTATVPLTDGHKMQLKHIGHAMNILWGPLTTFSTHNYADTYSPLLRTLCEGYGETTQEEEPAMPTLQEMHRMTAASPASTATFWILREELKYIHLYGMDRMHIGHHYLHRSDTYLREDNMASSGTAGIIGFGESSLCPGEAQARGFAHGHDKKTSIPKGHRVQYQDLKTVTSRHRQLQQKHKKTTSTETEETDAVAERPPSENDHQATSTNTGQTEMEAHNERLKHYVTTRQYESSTLPGKQLGINLPLTPFSDRQQQQSRYDGEYEIDGTTQRELVPVVAAEPAAHIARANRKADAQGIPHRNAYSHVPLTGHALTLQPAYQLTQNIGEPHKVIRHGELPEESTHKCTANLNDTHCFAEDGTFQHFLIRDEHTDRRRKPSLQELHNDAKAYEEAYAHDTRWLSAHNHDHTCATTCIKKMKKATMEEKKQVLKCNKAPPCRFWFIHMIIFTVMNAGKEVVKRIRRRGKRIVKEPIICNTNEHNEYGLVEPERPQPFRAPFSDVMCNAERANVDFRIMARGYPMEEDIAKHVKCDARSLARCYPDIAFRDISQPAARRMAHSVLALHVASHNCDYYIVKYQCKSLEQLQNLVTQYAVGIQRLEAEEKEAMSSGAERWTTKERARRVTIKLQSAANRCHWFSSTELAIFLRTGGTCWMSHHDTPLFLSKIIFMMHACQRLMEDRSPGLMEAANVPLQVVELQKHTRTAAPLIRTAHSELPNNSMTIQVPSHSDSSNIQNEHATGDEIEARVAAEPADNDNAMPLPTADAESCDTTHSNEDDHTLDDNSDERTDDSDYEPSNSPTTPTEDTEISEIEEDAYRPVRLHATTSRFDDWLHRGPWLHSLPYFIYIHHTRRIRKSRTSKAGKQASQRFEFDAHYEMSTLYQQEMDKGTIPRIVGTQCKQYEENHGEDYALWHLAIFGLARCPGTGCCCEVTMFKSMLTPKKSFRPPDTAPPSREHSYLPAWLARLRELKLLSERGTTKVQAAQRIPTIFDTSLVKHWTPEHMSEREYNGIAASSHNQYDATRCHRKKADNDAAVLSRSRDVTLARITILQLTLASLEQWIGAVFSKVCSYMDITTGYHEHQLHIEEYTAIRCMEAISNINFQLLVAKKPFKVETTNANDDDDADDDLLPDNDVRWKEAECMGGTQDDDTEDEEYTTEMTQTSKVQIDLARCCELLARKDEIARAKAPGRHKESETQMKNFPKCLHAINNQPLPPIPHDKITTNTCFTTPPHDNEVAAKHQEAIKILNRDQLDGIITNTDTPNDFNEEAWRAMLRRNAERDKPQCQSIPIEDMAKGPAHVAWMLITKCSNEDPPIHFNDEQIECIALQIWDIEQAFRKRQSHTPASSILPDAHTLVGGKTEPIRSRYLLPNDLGLPRTLTAGGGGCGKTTMLEKVICPTYATYFERIDKACPSNKAARLFNAKTMHALNGFTPTDSLRTANIRIRTDRMRKRTQAVHIKSGALFIDEYGQLQCQLWHANNLLWSIARQPRYNLRLDDYALPREICGRISKIHLSGDHLQLPPVPKSTSLLADIEGTSNEHKAGAAMFASIEQVFELQTMMRFSDPVLIEILRKMRTPGGSALTDTEWKRLKKTNVDESTMDEGQIHQIMMKTTDWYHSCYLWSIVNLTAYTSAKLTAKKSHHTLFYLQAVDKPKVTPRHAAPDPETGAPAPATVAFYEKLLQINSLSATRRLPGWTCFHQAQRIRITTSILVPHVVQDSTGEIKFIALHPADRHALQGITAPAEYKLKYPPTLYVQVDGLDHEYLPPIACQEHQDLGHIDDEHRNNIYDTCTQCKRFPGLVQVKPQKATWYYTDEQTNYKSAVERIQLPIMPEPTCPLYGLQGTTADPGLWAHWNMTGRMDPEVKWLLVYVMLSRVRTLDRLVSSGLTEKIREIIESGPPKMLVGNFEKLFGDKIKKTRIAAREARENLGWTVQNNVNSQCDHASEPTAVDVAR